MKRIPPAAFSSMSCVRGALDTERSSQGVLRLAGPGTDLSNTAGGTLEKQHRRFGGRLFQPLFEILEQRQTGKCIKRQRWFLWRDFVPERFFDGGQQLLQGNRLLQEVDGTNTRGLDSGVDRSMLTS